jgi:uncharacterized protein with PIN domain
MLRGLARWLRAAGYDTALPPPGSDDRAVLARAAADSRHLVTRDRGLAEAARRVTRVHRLESEGLHEWAAELRVALGIDWLAAPLTRCLVDNAVLEPAGPADLARVPPGALGGAPAVTACPECGRVYWPGSHVRRIHARLAAWQDGGGRERGSEGWPTSPAPTATSRTASSA